MKSENARLMLAIVLTTIVMIVWQKYFMPQTPTPPQKQTQEVAQANSVNNKQNEVSMNSQKTETKKNTPVATDTTGNVENINLENQGHSVSFANSLVLENITNAKQKHPFSDDYKTEGYHFLKVMVHDDQGVRELIFPVNDGELTSNSWTSSVEGYQLNSNLDDLGRYRINLTRASPFKLLFKIHSEAKDISYYNVKNFLLLSNDLETIEVGDEDKYDMLVKWFGVDFNYHFFGVVFPEKVTVVAKSNEDNELTVKTSKAALSHEFFLTYVKKDYDYLETFGDQLHLSIDFGMWAIIAVPMLHALQFFYDLIPNWGVAIILLTFFIRMLTLPLQMKSFKSMKKMQVIQPELQKLREKYKDDPQRMQRESMELFKRAGANPMGGCLPMLLQLPIFVAFYQMLNRSIELVDAPFALWITDLSVKDPYYVLPVLMGASMFLQQRFTPTQATDPVQKKVFMFMPLIFAVMMKDLPAGMNLYIFVSTIVGVAQQLIVQRKTD